MVLHHTQKRTMKKTKILLLCTLLSLAFTACFKDNEDILALLKEIKAQNSELRDQVVSLQKTADSLSSLIVATNKQTIALDKKVDSVQAQLAILLGQIATPNARVQY
jgi:peptidoglycan hydrolase CwlO-like protein